ncbi:MAG: hypothetical protein HFJ61_04795 [Akkermansia muciniphila]|nr:hypothetical protein [Akkermansia muciniphila]
MLMSVSPVTRLQEAFLMQHFYTEDAAEESRKYRMGKDLPSSPRKNIQTVKGTRLRPRSDRKTSGISDNELREINGRKA